jgi:hypothetical protein
MGLKLCVPAILWRHNKYTCAIDTFPLNLDLSAALPHNRRLLFANEQRDHVPSSLSSPNNRQLTNSILYFDPSMNPKEEIHKPKAPLPEDEVDDGLDAMKVLDVDLLGEHNTQTPPALKEAFPDVRPEDLTLEPTHSPDTVQTTLASLVDKEMTDAITNTNEMGPVQQSLASALNQDIKNLLKAYEETIYATVKTLKEDYNLKTKTDG